MLTYNLVEHKSTWAQETCRWEAWGTPDTGAIGASCACCAASADRACRDFRRDCVGNIGWSSLWFSALRPCPCAPKRQSGKFVRGKQDGGAMRSLQRRVWFTVWTTQFFLLKALIAKTKATSVHGFKPFDPQFLFQINADFLITSLNRCDFPIPAQIDWELLDSLYNKMFWVQSLKFNIAAYCVRVSGVGWKPYSQ